MGTKSETRQKWLLPENPEGNISGGKKWEILKKQRDLSNEVIEPRSDDNICKIDNDRSQNMD